MADDDGPDRSDPPSDGTGGAALAGFEAVEEAEEIPTAGRLAGVALAAFSGLALLAAPFLARGQPIATGLLAVLALATAAFGVLVAVQPDEMARVFRRLGLAPTSVAAACTGLLLVDLVAVLGIPVVYAVGSLERIAAGIVTPGYTPFLETLPELAVRRLVSLSFWTVPIAAFLVLAERRRPRDAARNLGLKPTGPGARGWARTLLLGLAWTVPVLIALIVTSRLVHLGLGGIAGGGGTGLLPLPHALLISATAGFGEEVFFRGFLQRRIGFWSQAVWFSVEHAAYLSLASMAVALVAGLLFGYMYKRTGSLWVPILAHAMYDVVVMTVPVPVPF